MNEARAWELSLRKRDVEYAKIIQEMPSLKTANFTLFKERVKLIFATSDWLLEFCRKKAFRKWEFKTSVYSKKALDLIAKRITKNGSRNKTLIGFGDWSQQDGFVTGKPKAPIQKLKNELRKHATVVKIDEYRTSKTCSCCRHEENMYNVKHRKERKERNRDGEMNVTSKLSESHEVVRCKNCTMSWQRDVNSSRNMYDLLMCATKGEQRPSAMNRSFSRPLNKSAKRLKPLI